MKAKIDISNLNVTKIIDAIAAAPIPDEKKHQALDDIKRMYTDQAYWDNVMDVNKSLRFDLIPVTRQVEEPQLVKHHIWANSDLGCDFWDKMDDIINGFV